MEACGLDVTESSPTTVDELRPLFPAEASAGAHPDVHLPRVGRARLADAQSARSLGYLPNQ
jgi:hypothetical protein